MATPIAIAVVEDRGRVLIGRRPPHKSLGGSWEFPGGRVERDESAEAAAVRECFEETGLRVTVVHTYCRSEYRYDHDHVQLHFFACRPESDATPREPFVWVPREQLARYAFPAGNAEVLAVLSQPPGES